MKPATILDPMPKPSAHLIELAKRGAETRFRELTQELRYLVQLFPHLHDSFDPDELPIAFIVAKGAGRSARVSKRPRRQRKWSAAARRAVSQRMRRYWAAKRKAAK